MGDQRIRDVGVEKRLDGATSREGIRGAGAIILRAVIRRLRMCSSSILAMISSHGFPGANSKSTTG